MDGDLFMIDEAHPQGMIVVVEPTRTRHLKVVAGMTSGAGRRALLISLSRGCSAVPYIELLDANSSRGGEVSLLGVVLPIWEHKSHVLSNSAGDGTVARNTSSFCISSLDEVVRRLGV